MEPNAAATEPGVGIEIDETSCLPAAGVVLVPLGGPSVVLVPLDGPHFRSEHLLLDEVHAVATAANDASAHTTTANFTAAVCIHPRRGGRRTTLIGTNRAVLGGFPWLPLRRRIRRAWCNTVAAANVRR
jgi:hypothetical protein